MKLQPSSHHNLTTQKNSPQSFHSLPISSSSFSCELLPVAVFILIHEISSCYFLSLLRNGSERTSGCMSSRQPRSAHHSGRKAGVSFVGSLDGCTWVPWSHEGEGRARGWGCCRTARRGTCCQAWPLHCGLGKLPARVGELTLTAQGMLASSDPKLYLRANTSHFANFGIF